MTHHVSFSYTEKAQTLHPHLEIEVTFIVNASIADNADETVTIENVFAKSAIDYAETESIPVAMPDESRFEGAKFWALLREAARTHFYKIQKQKNEAGNQC